jgi:hypothetical protein
MELFERLSDQLFNWSDKNDKTNKSATSPSDANQTPSELGPGSTQGLVDRTLQKMRKTRLQVCRGARSRTKVLLVCEHAGRPSGDDLCPAGILAAGGGASGESRGGPRGDRRDLRNQPRASAAAGRAVRHGSRLRCIHRIFCGCNPCRQHDRELSLCGSCRKERTK